MLKYQPRYQDFSALLPYDGGPIENRFRLASVDLNYAKL